MEKHIRNIVIILIISLILELTIFNINFYRLFNSKDCKIFKGSGIQYVESDEDTTLVQISNINTEVKTVHVEIKEPEKVDYVFLYTDETKSNLKETPAKTYVEKLENSKYITTYLSRKK